LVAFISHTKTFEQTSQRATLRWLKGKTLYTLLGAARGGSHQPSASSSRSNVAGREP